MILFDYFWGSVRRFAEIQITQMLIDKDLVLSGTGHFITGDVINFESTNQ